MQEIENTLANLRKERNELAGLLRSMEETISSVENLAVRFPDLKRFTTRRKAAKTTGFWWRLGRERTVPAAQEA